MSAFVLVHGAWHGAWCWREVVPRLEARGHTADALDLPSHGADSADPSRVTLDDYVARVVEALERAGEPAILVGHSLGGVSISASAARHPDRVARLVYLAAFVPHADAPAFEPHPALASALRVDRDRGVMEIDPGVAEQAFYADCSPEDVAFACASLCPQSRRVSPAARDVDPAFLASPSAYIECRDDRALDPAQQRALAALLRDPLMYALDASHSPFFSQPDRLVEILDEIARAS